MKCSDDKLHTPIYLKLEEATPWPETEPAFYLLSRDGLFLCRNHGFFRSCVRAREAPAELASQTPFLQLNYPRLPRRLLERIIGFFALVGERHGSEAVVLLAWDADAHSLVPIVPDQVGTVSLSTCGNPFPIDLRYEIPPLPPNLILIGDIHSHVDGPAYASATDRDDEWHRPGLHLVVGRIHDEPPEFHCEVVADGARFPVADLSLVAEGYQYRRRRDVPQQWLDKVTVRPRTWRQGSPPQNDPAPASPNAAFPPNPNPAHHP